MLTQYSSKLLIALLTLQHALRIRLQHGTKGYHAVHGGSSLAKKVERLASIISDARVLYRIWGILPIIKTVREQSVEEVKRHKKLIHEALLADDFPGKVTTTNETPS